MPTGVCALVEHACFHSEVTLTCAIPAGKALEPLWFPDRDHRERHVPALLPAAVQVSAAKGV